MSTPEPDYDFPALTEADLPLIRRWLLEPHVSRWWADPPRATYPDDELEKYRTRFGAMAPLKRVGSAQDVADSILFLVSERASFMTGQILRPNGGTAMPW